MIITTTENIHGKKIKETLGIVKGNTIRARWFGRDIAAGIKNLFGGEIKSYTKMLTDSRDEAMKRMVDEAKKMGANAIVGVRFTTSDVMQGSAEILVFGTAIKI